MDQKFNHHDYGRARKQHDQKSCGKVCLVTIEMRAMEEGNSWMGKRGEGERDGLEQHASGCRDEEEGGGATHYSRDLFRRVTHIVIIILIWGRAVEDGDEEEELRVRKGNQEGGTP